MGCNLNEGGEKSTILNAYTYSSTLTYDSNTYTRTACAFQTEFDPKFECVCGNCTMLCMWCQGKKRRRVVFLSCLLCFATTVRNQFSWQFRIELLQLIIVFVHFGWSERRTGCAVIHAFHSKLNWVDTISWFSVRPFQPHFQINFGLYWIWHGRNLQKNIVNFEISKPWNNCFNLN